jgi:hypothetical protein
MQLLLMNWLEAKGNECINNSAYLKYDINQDQQGKVAFNERNHHTSQQQEPVARSQDGPCFYFKPRGI